MMLTIVYYFMNHSNESHSAWFYISAILVALIIGAIIFGFPVYVPFIKKIAKKIKSKQNHEPNNNNTNPL